MAKLGEEINQSEFDNHKEKGMINILYTSNWVRDQTAPFFKEYGILQQHYNILRIIRGKKGEPTSPGMIIKVMLDKGRDLTRLVDKLVKLDLLERKPCESNRRKVDIFITQVGLDVTQKIEDKLDRWYDTVNDVTNDEAKMLNDLLDKFRG